MFSPHSFGIELTSLIKQSQQLPKGFSDYFFGAPLMANIVIDDKNLGSGELILGRDNSVRLINLVDISESEFSDKEREIWKTNLAGKLKLGKCSVNCSVNILIAYYSLDKSQLSIITRQAEMRESEDNYLTLPDENLGLLLRNQLRWVSEGEKQTGLLNFQLEGNVDSWTLFSEGDVVKGDYNQQSIRQAYIEQLNRKYYTRFGYFTPDSQGLIHQQNYFSSNDINTVGVMFGNSDLLRKDQGVPSLVPIQLTSARPGIVEIYKNGQLLQSQLIQSGLQMLDTKTLPAGIYEIELRILEDGQETQRKTEMVYKPSSWTTPEDRWRYNLYAGWQVPLWSNIDEDIPKVLTAGVELNHLLTPSTIVGIGNRYADKRLHQSISFDWNVSPSLRWLSTLNHSEGIGWGYNAQGIINLNTINMVLGHTARHTTHHDDASTAYFSMQYPLLRWGSTNLYLAHQPKQGSSVNLSWSYAERWQGEWVNWGLTLFDRPGSLSTNNERDRGARLSFSISFGYGNGNLSLGLGSRTSRSGEQDQEFSLNYQQQMDLGPLKQISAGITQDNYGSGFSGYGRYSADWVDGDVFMQNSSYNRDWSYGVNMDSSIAINRKGSAIGSGGGQQEAAMILDIESDTAEARLRVSSDGGKSMTLGSGRHLVPVAALENGTLQFDMIDQYSSPLTIRPAFVPYYLNRGGVGYHKVQVVKTVTVIGRLVDEHAQPLGGAKVINHVGRTVSEPDGFFVVDVSLKQPSLTVENEYQSSCEFSLGDLKNGSIHDTILVGDLLCKSSSIAKQYN
ncbi:CS1-pili formation C-terminal domain-containing protein [Vibrio sp. V03_P4A6T147]|uniref:CS1-pili formation C-terminal domain-containing protein n=1 Tax=Vibrio sp. V03_P4A6T147 TaxID=1938658 RepID=UPI0015C61FFA